AGRVPPGAPPRADAPLADVQAQIKAAAGRPKSAAPRQYTSRVLPVRGRPAGRAVCIGYEIFGPPTGAFVVAFDFSRMVTNEARHSPRNLYFVTDRNGVFLAHPDEAKVGSRITDDHGKDGKPRFDFKQVPWAGAPTRSEPEQTRGESLIGVTPDPTLAYLFTRKPYDKGSPFRDE